MLMTTVKLPGAATKSSHMGMHTKMSNTDIRPARVFQKHISDPTRTHGLIDHRKYRKRYCKRKWKECEYHVQES